MPTPHPANIPVSALGAFARPLGLGLREALEHAHAQGLAIHKHADPVEDLRLDLSLDEALEVLAVDPGLLFLAGSQPRDGSPAPNPRTVRLDGVSTPGGTPLVAVRLLPEERERLVAAAKREGTNNSEVIRRLIRTLPDPR